MANEGHVNHYVVGYQSFNFELKSLLLSQKIEDALKEHKLSKKEFANLMGVQPSIVTRWLSGKHNFTIETLFEIEDRLKIRLVAIDPPKSNTMSFQLKVKSNQVSIEESNMFSSFTSIDLNDKPLDGSDGKRVDIEAFLTEMRNVMFYEGK